MASKNKEFERITEPPKFTIDDLKKAIPSECFNRESFISLYYFLRDYFLILGVYYVMIWKVEPFISTLDPVLKTFFSVIAYPLFWFVQGTLFWCLFVIGHDCGHGSFSKTRT